MSFYWLFFASLTVVGSLTYNVMMKMGSSHMNVFGFVLISSLSLFVAQATCFSIAKYVFKLDVTQGFSPDKLVFPIICGFSIALIDICYFFALRYGSPIACQTFWTVGGTIALVVFSILFFKETITPTKALGIVLGIVSLFLITRQS